MRTQASKFTPGPWSAVCNDKVTQLIKAGRNEVARISHSTFGTDTDHANAALIAAAPMMYEFIESLIQAETNPLIVEHCKLILALARGEQ